MITRRSALAMLPAGLMAGSSFFSLARAQAPAIKPDPDAARRILAALDGYSKTPHYEATKPLIQFFSNLAVLRTNAANQKNRLNSKSELADALNQHNAIYAPVNTVLDISKKVDDVIEGDKKRRISPQDKTKLRTEIDIKNSRLNDILGDLFSGSGYFDVNNLKNTKNGSATIDKLTTLSDELLKASIDLSNWGPDAFYAIARGYATFQFVRDRIRTSRSSPLLARAYTLKIIGDSESYFSLRAVSLTATAPTTPSTSTTPATTSSTPAPALTANARYAVEKEMIDKRFPREIYLGSELSNPENGCGRGQLVNHYGRFTADSSFDRSFKLDGADGWSNSGCTSVLSDKGSEALNNLLSPAFKGLSPKEGNANSFKKSMRDIQESINRHIDGLKRRKNDEDQKAGGGSAPPPPPPPSTGPEDDASKEFGVMQQMTSALREVLALT